MNQQLDTFFDYSILGTTTVFVLMTVGLFIDKMFTRFAEKGKLHYYLSVPLQIGVSLFVVELFLTTIFSKVSFYIGGQQEEAVTKILVAFGILTSQPRLKDRIMSLL